MKKITGKRIASEGQPAGQLERSLEAAYRYLSYRPRSESELRSRLSRRGFEPDIVAATLARLKERGLLDDAAFARFWTENRESFSPRSRRLTRLELKRKGVEEEVISQAINGIDDGDSAYRAALSRAGRLPVADFAGFQKRLGSYLHRRGFSYEDINSAIKRTWQELGGQEKTPVSE